MRSSVRTVAGQGGQYLLLGGYVLFLVFPLLWMASTSLKPTPEIYGPALRLVPEDATAAHYATVLSETRVLRSMGNSLVVGGLSTVAVLLLALPAAYALARYRTAVNKAVLGWILTTQIFPSILLIVPLYVVLRRSGLTDTLLGLGAVYTVWNLPFVLWLLQGYIRDLPVELEEAAAIDGAGRVQILFRVLVPLLLPALGAAALFAFISAWNEFFFALVLMKSPTLVTLPVELATFTGMEGQARTGPLAAASLLATLPSLVLFVVLRRGLTSGFLAGALK
jgi:multiple sugar transport system permease protein